MQEIVVATGNQGKLKEINQVLHPFGLQALGQKQLNVPDIEETGLTFVENAILKARNAARLTGKPALADDSGLALTHVIGH